MLAVLVGAALSTAGALFQGFRNPLVSPDILGVSAGCCLGAALGIVLSRYIYSLSNADIGLYVWYFGYDSGV